MAGRYDDFNLNSGQYIPQYAGSPLEVLNDTGETLAKRHYANIADMSAMELLGKQLKQDAVSEDAKATVDSHIKQIQDELANLSKNGAENSTAKVTALKNAFMGNEDLLAIKSLSGNYKKFLEEKSKKTTPIYNTRAEQEILNAPVRDPQTGKLSSVYSRPFDLQVAEKLDWLAQQDEVLAPLKPDSFQTDLMKSKPTGMTDAEFLQSNTYQSLSRGKVNDYLFGNKEGRFQKDSEGNITGAGWRNYKTTASYKQQHDIMGMSDEEIADELRGRGLSKVFSNTEKEFKDVTPSDSGGSSDGVKPTGTEFSTSTAVENLVGYDPNLFDPTKQANATSIPNDGNAAAEIKKYKDAGYKVDYLPGSGPGAQGQYLVKTAPGSDITKAPAYQAYKKDLTAAAEAFTPGFTKMSEAQKEAYLKTPEAREAHAAYIHDIALRGANNPMTVQTDEKSRKALTDDLKSNYTYRMFYDPATGEQVSPTDKTGTSTKKFNEMFNDYDLSTMDVIGQNQPLNFETNKMGSDYTEGYRVRVYGKGDNKNKSKEVFVSPSVGYLESAQGKAASIENQAFRTLAAKPGAWHELNLEVRNGGESVPITNILKIAPETNNRLKKQGYTTGTVRAKELYGYEKAEKLAALKAKHPEANIPDDIAIISVVGKNGKEQTILGYNNIIRAGALQE